MGALGGSAVELWWKGRTLLRIARSDEGAWLNSAALAHGHIIAALPCRFEHGGAAATCAVLANGVDIVIGPDVHALRTPVGLRGAFALPRGVLLVATSDTQPLWVLSGHLRAPRPLTWQRTSGDTGSVTVLTTAAAHGLLSIQDGHALVVLYEPGSSMLSLHCLSDGAGLEQAHGGDAATSGPNPASAASTTRVVASASLRAFAKDDEVPQRAWVSRQINGALAVSVLLPASQQLCTFTLEPETAGTQQSLKLRELLPATSVCALRCLPQTQAPSLAMDQVALSGCTPLTVCISLPTLYIPLACRDLQAPLTACLDIIPASRPLCSAL